MVSAGGAVLSSLLALAVATESAPDALAEADALYYRRAEGARGARALPGPIDRAIAAYRRALDERPDLPEARWKLLRALFFRASFCGSPPEERRRLIEEARRVAEDGTSARPSPRGPTTR
jgi:hypothetical protein